MCGVFISIPILCLWYSVQLRSAGVAIGLAPLGMGRKCCVFIGREELKPPGGAANIGSSPSNISR
jgi:hypothetical protein